MRTLFDRTAFDPRFTGSLRPASPGINVLSLALLVAVCIVVVHAALIPLGSWRYDEFDTFKHIRDGGLTFVWTRIAGWSPRPASELFLYGYGSVVEMTGRRNVASFLALLWFVLAAGLFGPALAMLRRDRMQGLLLATVSAVVFASFLVGHRIDEVFFWTQGAAAYVPTLAAICAITTIHIATCRSSRNVRIATGSLAVIAALSSEMGASFAVAYGASMLLLDRIQSMRPLRLTSFRRCDLEYVIALLAGLLIFYLSSRGRLGVGFEAVGDPAIVHRVVPSVAGALWDAPREFLTLGVADGGIGPALRGVFALIAFCLGLLILFAVGGRSADRQTRKRLLGIGLAASGAAFLSLAAAYYQFGLACCSRHETMRRCLFFVALLCFVFLLYSVMSERLRSFTGNARAGACASALLIASMLTGFSTSYRPLLADLENYGQLIAISRANWESGISEEPSMTYRQITTRMICSPDGLNEGRYRTDGNMPPQVAYIARYFGKEDVVISGQAGVCEPM